EEIGIEHAHLGDVVHRELGALRGLADRVRIRAVVDAEALGAIRREIRMDPGDAFLGVLSNDGAADLRAFRILRQAEALGKAAFDEIAGHGSLLFWIWRTIAGGYSAPWSAARSPDHPVRRRRAGDPTRSGAVACAFAEAAAAAACVRAPDRASSAPAEFGRFAPWVSSSSLLVPFNLTRSAQRDAAGDPSPKARKMTLMDGDCAKAGGPARSPSMAGAPAALLKLAPR